MKIGPFIRSHLPYSLERWAAQRYRRIFVDLKKVAGMLSSVLPASANVLDIGGGDGELLNCLLAARTDLRISMVDIAPSVGKFVEPRYSDRVQLFPGTSLEKHVSERASIYEAALISDVMHHLSPDYRKAFLASIWQALTPGGLLLVKDIQPGHPVSYLSLFSDIYISGDKGVSLVSMAAMKSLAEETISGCHVFELGLLAVDRPNYLLKISAPPA